MKLLSFSLLLLSINAFAAPSIVGTKLQRGIAINTMDDPGEIPFYSAQIWESMTGSQMKKVVKTAALSITCETLISEPQRQRFGSCSIDIPANRVKESGGYYGLLLSGNEAKEHLRYFVGNEASEFPRVVNTNIANGTIMISADHVRSLFGISVKKSIFD